MWGWEQTGERGRKMRRHREMPLWAWGAMIGMVLFGVLGPIPLVVLVVLGIWADARGM